MLDEIMFAGATPAAPKRIMLADPAARWIAVTREAPSTPTAPTNLSTSITRSDDVSAPGEGYRQRRMIEKTQGRFGLRPERKMKDTASWPNLR